MNKKFITLHQASDNSTVILNSECVILATASVYGNTALVTVDNKSTSTKHTFYLNESVERVRAMLSEAEVPTVLVHGCNNNDEILITTNNIFSIIETKRCYRGKQTVGSTIYLQQEFVGSIDCNETYAKIASKL